MNSSPHSGHCDLISSRRQPLYLIVVRVLMRDEECGTKRAIVRAEATGEQRLHKFILANRIIFSILLISLGTSGERLQSEKSVNENLRVYYYYVSYVSF